MHRPFDFRLTYDRSVLSATAAFVCVIENNSFFKQLSDLHDGARSGRENSATGDAREVTFRSIALLAPFALTDTPTSALALIRNWR